jgi:hypothetical protein
MEKGIHWNFHRIAIMQTIDSDITNIQLQRNGGDV